MIASALATPSLSLGPTGLDLQALLFERYAKALALLCECQPYVDEPDYEAQIDALLREACTDYGMAMQHVDGRFEIALSQVSVEVAPGARRAS